MATTTTATNTTESPVSVDTGDIEGFGLVEVQLADESLLLAVADTAELRGQGLMFVEDFGDLDGMVFVFEDDVTNRFWMRNTFVSLDIAFFSAEGTLVDLFEMTPCLTPTCPRYQAAGVYRYAIERPAGTMVGAMTSAAVLDVASLEDL